MHRVGALTQSVDLLPMIFDLFEIPYPDDELQGRSLVPLLAGEVDQVHDHVFARDAGDPASYLVRDLRYALILYEGGEPRALYDLDEDPHQTCNLIHEYPEKAAELIAAFRRFAETQRLQPLQFIDPGAEPAPVPSGPQLEISDGMREELKALGYVD